MDIINYQKVGIVITSSKGNVTQGYLLEMRPNINVSTNGNLSADIEQRKTMFYLEDKRLIVTNEDNMQEKEKVRQELSYIYGTEIEFC